MDEAGFDLKKRRRRGQRAIVEVPDQRGDNVTLCATISIGGLLHHHATLRPYDTQHLFTFLRGVRDVFFGREQQDHEQAQHPVYIVVWDNVTQFHHGVLIQERLNINQPSTQ